MLRRPGLAQGPSARWLGQPSLGLGEPLQSPGMWASPWGPQTERREGAKGGRRVRRARACLPNLVSETTRAATSCPGPVATLQREVPLQTEGVCLSGAHAPCHRSGRRRSGARLPGLPSRRRRALGGPCRGLEAAGVVGSCPGHHHSQQRPAGSLERSRRPPVLTLLLPHPHLRALRLHTPAGTTCNTGASPPAQVN